MVTALNDGRRWPGTRLASGAPFKIALSQPAMMGQLIYSSRPSSDAISRWRTPAPGSWNEELIFDASAPSSGRQTGSMCCPILVMSSGPAPGCECRRANRERQSPVGLWGPMAQV